MRRSPIRWGFLAAAVLTFSVGTVAVFPPEAAQAATVPSITTMGGPINVLPSAVKSGTAGYSSAEYMTALLYKASKSPEFWSEYRAAQAAAAAKPGTALVLSPSVAAEANAVYPAASKALPYVKTLGRAAGAAGAVMTAYQLSSTLTNGVMDMVGLDATGTVCRSTSEDLWGAVVKGAAGTNCSGYNQKIADAFEPNTDVTVGQMLKTCSQVVDACASLVGTAVIGGDTFYCMSLSGSDATEPSSNFGATAQASSGGLYFRIGSGSSKGSFYQTGGYNRQRECQSTSGVYSFATPTSYTFDGALWGADFSKGIRAADPIKEGSADPSRTLKCVIAGTDGIEYIGVSDEFLESGGVLPKVKCPDLPQGVTADSAKIVETGGSQGDDPIWSAQTDPAVKDALQSGCGTSTGTQCALELLQDGKSCFDGADCKGWYTDPNKTTRYQCQYGGKTVDLGECTVYAPRWEPTAQTTGNTLGDPTTGDPLKNPKPELSPGSSASVEASPADTDLGSYNCWPSGFGAFNPVNWVLQPIKCAFVPRDGYLDSEVQTVQQTASKTYMGRFASTVGAWNFQGPGSGCTGIPIHLGGAIPDFTIMAACPGDTLAPMASWGRIFLDLAVTVAGVFAIARFIGSAVGFTGVGKKEDD